MKKTICIVLSVLFCFSMVACGKKEKKKAPAIDLQYYTSNGVIPEISCKLGVDINTLKQQLSESAKPETDDTVENIDEDGSENSETIPSFQETEGEETVWIDNGKWFFCYEKDNVDKGIIYIADLSTAFGLEPGTVISEVKEKLDPLSLKERDAKEGEFYVPFGEAERTVLEYQNSGRTVLFVFEDNALVATILYDTNLWKY